MDTTQRLKRLNRAWVSLYQYRIQVDVDEFGFRIIIGENRTLLGIGETLDAAIIDSENRLRKTLAERRADVDKTEATLNEGEPANSPNICSVCMCDIPVWRRHPAVLFCSAACERVGRSVRVSTEPVVSDIERDPNLLKAREDDRG